MRVDNRSYWEAQAADYDSLYTTRWWRREDDRITACCPGCPCRTVLPSSM